MKTIICHSFPAWDTPYVKSTIEIIKRLSSDHRIIFLDYPYTLKDYFANDHAPKTAMFSRKCRVFNTEFGKVEVYNSLPTIPVNWVENKTLFNFLMWINGLIQSLTISQIRKHVTTEETYVVNAFNPVYGYFTSKYWKGLPISYYSYDQLDFTPWASKWGKVFEPLFVRKVNRVIVSSSGLKQKFDALHERVFCVKNGVTLDHFLGNRMEKTHFRKMGYLGAFDERIDLKLLSDVAKAFPSYLIEILGPNKITSVSLPPNVIFLGKKKPNDLLPVIESWDVALIPFLSTEFTRAIYPLKINEYLAAGKPVISTNFSDLSDFESVVRVADDSESFIDGIKKEIRYNNRLKISKRVSFAKANSWEHRAGQFVKALSA